MSIIASTILFLSVLSVATAQQKNFNLTQGSSLSPSGNSSLLSQSGLFAFGFFPFGDGYSISIWFEGIPQKTVVWTANRNDPPLSRNANIVFTSDGRLVWQELGNQEKSIANATQPAAVASLLDSGNFVLYDSNSTIIWQSFDYPTDTLLPNQLLRVRSQLVSSSSETNHSTGIFRIKMQNDGNLVLYQYAVGVPDHPDYAYWSAVTNFVGNNATLTLDKNGRLYMLNRTGVVVKNITNEVIPSDGKMYRATIDNDGIFRLYSHDLGENGNWSIVWLVPGDPCLPIGICGVNGYCDIQNQQAFCTCPPGFVFINQEQMNLGCSRNFTAESCSSKNEHTKYAIQEFQNAILEDSAYAVLFSVTKEECNQACLEDCNCEAAFYQNRECRKQKLPLTVWRSTVQGDGYSNATFIKFGSGIDDMVPKDLESKKVLRMDILIIGVACLALASILLAVFAVLIFRYRIWTYKRLSREAATEGILMEDVSLRAFTYSELEVATNGFVEQLGRGSFGTVFKGTLSNGQRTIAVKRLEKVVAEGEGEEEFRNEMRSIGRTHHKNLVRLLGYCHDGSNRLLVYEYMRNGTLADYLFKSQVKPNWEERIKIALNIARGILYLHEECETQIIHCDINPNNILMDENGRAKISDFGLAKLLMPDHSKTLTGIRGTRGYVAPEWLKNLPITVKADVYSFGVVFLVNICCRRNIDINAPQDEIILVDWVYDCFKSNQLRRLVPEEVDAESLERMVKIGLWCIEDDPVARPSMKKVIQMLEGTVEIPIPPCARSAVED
jgi:thiamine kinase-like enzyme